MSLEQPGTSRKVRARNQRNRPRLVTEQAEGSDTNTLAPDTEKLAVDIPEIDAATEPVTTPKPRRLPGFFSTVGKNDQEDKPKEVDVAQARLARATRGKITQSEKATSSKKTETKTTRPANSATRTPARPTSTFKTRYILGMALYLVGASYIGGLEQTYMKSIGIDRQLTSFNLFSLPITITTSSLVFLATLIIVLVILARLDLIPRSLTGMTSTPTPAPAPKTRTKTREQAPPAVTSGDKLYQEYKANQRREKKR